MKNQHNFSHSLKNAMQPPNVGEIKVELNFPLKATAIFKKQTATLIPLQLQDRIQHLFDILTHFDIIAPVNTDSLTTGNTFFYPCNHP